MQSAQTSSSESASRRSPRRASPCPALLLHAAPLRAAPADKTLPPAGARLFSARWDVARALQLNCAPGGGMWSATIELTSGRAHKYKYIVKDGQGNVVRWQPGANNLLVLRRSDKAIEVRDRSRSAHLSL